MAARIERISDTSSDVGCSIGRRLAANEAGTASCGVSRDRRFRDLIDAGLDRLPQPGHGATLQRWQALERVARHDLALVKLYEGHTDALAILRELEPSRLPARGCAYAVWASEARVDPIRSGRPAPPRIAAGDVRIDGRKSWCSGASVVDAALMTAADANGERRTGRGATCRPPASRSTPPLAGGRHARHGQLRRRLRRRARARLVGPVDGYLRDQASGTAGPASPRAGSARRRRSARACATCRRDATTSMRSRISVRSMRRSRRRRAAARSGAPRSTRRPRRTRCGSRCGSRGAVADLVRGRDPSCRAARSVRGRCATTRRFAHRSRTCRCSCASPRRARPRRTGPRAARRGGRDARDGWRL